MKLTNFLWALPFICFISTYTILTLIFTAPPIPAPSLIGKQLPEAFTILSHHNLNPRILHEQVDNDVPAGTILSQTPLAGQKIKPYQQLFLTVSKKAEKTIAPSVQGKTYEQVVEQLTKAHIKHKRYDLASKKPMGTIIAQLPAAGAPLEQNSMILYVSQGNNKPILCPQFIGKTVKEVTQFLETYNIAPEVYHAHTMYDNHSCANCVVLNQQPLAGTIIDLHQGLTVQLKVTHCM
ncbi:MAG: PASTA domain-containing protein [Candidatus Babeliales bacterium]